MKRRAGAWLGYLCAVGLAGLCTVIGLAMETRFDIVNIAMIYLLCVVVVALYFSRGAAIWSAVLSVGAFDLVFVPPPGTFNVHDVQYLLTFLILLAVALVISRLMDRNRRQIQEQARLMIDAETERSRTALLASISHDLRTPLAVLAGASSSLLESGHGMNEEERTALAGSIFSQTQEMSSQVEKILQMTRIETCAIQADLDWADIAEITGSALNRLSERLARHHVLVHIPEDLPLIQLDAALIEQALVNLLENAAKHTPVGTIVQIRAESLEDEIVISVIDSGPGIAEERIAGVFAKFQHGASSGTASGIGLGLAICRAIIGLHQGRIWAENVIDGGVAFHMSLPLGAAPVPPADIATA